MDVRASDAERDACVDQLRDAAAEGRLTLEELADRIEAAASSATRGELAKLTADLPAPLPAASPHEASMIRTAGDIKRSGAWVVPAECAFRSYFGHIKLDLRDARMSATEVHIHAFAMFGNVDLLVPEGVHVDIRARARIGQLKHEAGSPPAPGAPRIVLTGGTGFGDVTVRHRRLWEKLVRLGR
jgi:DUF1707 SHOCT-like domain/Cell wall-active antibiotics response LiaF, C-terminal